MCLLIKWNIKGYMYDKWKIMFGYERFNLWL